MGSALYVRKILAKLKRNTIENWGVPFILTFIILLSSSAILVVADFNKAAEIGAIIAYFALLVGVILQIVCFSKKRKTV